MRPRPNLSADPADHDPPHHDPPAKPDYAAVQIALCRQILGHPRPPRLPDRESFICPRCGMTSHNPNDVAEGYCGNCHDWTGGRHEDPSTQV